MHILNEIGNFKYPFIFAILMALIIIIEKLIVYMSVSFLPKKEHWKQEIDFFSMLSGTPLGRKPYTKILLKTMRILIVHQELEKVIREEIVLLWLGKIQKKLKNGIKILNIIGSLSPILGLLGTVVGLINTFSTIAQEKTAINPAILSDGIGLSMYTTAIGLMLALPCLLVSNLFTLWNDSLFDNVVSQVNEINLTLEVNKGSDKYDQTL